MNERFAPEITMDEIYDLRAVRDRLVKEEKERRRGHKKTLAYLEVVLNEKEGKFYKNMGKHFDDYAKS